MKLTHIPEQENIYCFRLTYSTQLFNEKQEANRTKFVIGRLEPESTLLISFLPVPFIPGCGKVVYGSYQDLPNLYVLIGNSRKAKQ